MIKEAQANEFKTKYILIVLLTVVFLACFAVLILSLTTDLFITERQQPHIVIYQGPGPVSASDDVSVSVEGHELFVYKTAVNNSHTWDEGYTPPLSEVGVASFDFEGGAVRVCVTIENESKIDNVKIRPLSREISPRIEKNSVTFELKEPDTYTLEWGDVVSNVLHIFARAVDHDAPTESTAQTLYVPPGAWDIGDLSLSDNTELYISGGAVVRGCIKATDAENITVRGRGVIDGSNNISWMLMNSRAFVPIDLSGCDNVTVSGISLFDPNAWCVNIYDCDNIRVDGVNIITARPNGDGITIQSSRNVCVTDCFIRSWDDALVVKNYSDAQGSDSENITFSGCQIWSDLAQAMEIGYETNKGKKDNAHISNITFENMTVLHSFHKPVMAIHNADDALISDIRFSNITIEDASMGMGDGAENAQLIDIAILKNYWSTTDSRGSVNGVLFDGVYVIGGNDIADGKTGNFCHIRISGYDGEHLVSNVTIKDLYILGTPITQKDAGLNPDTSIDNFAQNVFFQIGEK